MSFSSEIASLELALAVRAGPVGCPQWRPAGTVATEGGKRQGVASLMKSMDPQLGRWGKVGLMSQDFSIDVPRFFKHGFKKI